MHLTTITKPMPKNFILSSAINTNTNTNTKANADDNVNNQSIPFFITTQNACHQQGKLASFLNASNNKDNPKAKRLSSYSAGKDNKTTMPMPQRFLIAIHNTIDRGISFFILEQWQQCLCLKTPFYLTPLLNTKSICVYATHHAMTTPLPSTIPSNLFLLVPRILTTKVQATISGRKSTLKPITN